MTVGQEWHPPDLGVGVVRDRIREVFPAARVVHRVVLCHFAGHGYGA